ncbi:MAG: hypothetical protein PVI92_04215 [Chromatiales bacterium]|jgi:hypothetical protein
MITPLGEETAPALRVAFEKAPLGVARRSFGIDKLLSSRLDWRLFRGNKAHWMSVNRSLFNGPATKKVYYTLGKTYERRMNRIYQ